MKLKEPSYPDIYQIEVKGSKSSMAGWSDNSITDHPSIMILYAGHK